MEQFDIETYQKRAIELGNQYGGISLDRTEDLPNALETIIETIKNSPFPFRKNKKQQQHLEFILANF